MPCHPAGWLGHPPFWTNPVLYFLFSLSCLVFCFQFTWVPHLLETGGVCDAREACVPLRRRDGRLHVVAVEVLLEVEVREGLTLTDGEELLERGIGLDVVLVLEALLLHVAVDRLRDLRARHERRNGLAKEEAELIRDLRGALEDGGDTGLDLLTLDGRRAALALAGILDLAVDTLVELLDLGEHRRDRLLKRVEVERHRLEVLIERRRGASGRGDRRRLNGRRGDDNGRGRRGGGRRLLGGLLGRLSDRRRRGNNGRRNGGNLLLRNDLLGRGGGLGGGGRHYTGG